MTGSSVQQTADALGLAYRTVFAMIRRGELPERASRGHGPEAGRVNCARQQARREQAELVIKDQQGRIESKDSHGHDPRRSKG
jgi:hypothetical protein